MNMNQNLLEQGSARRRMVIRLLLTAGMAVAAAAACAAEPAQLRTGKRSVTSAIAEGVAFLEAAQRPSGEFPFDVCHEPAMAHCQANGHTAITSVVLHSLDFVHDKKIRPAIDAMATNGVAFVQAQMEPDGLWRPSPKSHPGYPMEAAAIQDTCVNALTLERYGQPVAKTANRLLAELNPQGVFHNFVGAMAPRPPPGQDPLHPSTRELVALIDPTVNSSALHYLTLRGQSLPGVCAYLNQVVVEGLRPGYSAIYPSIYPFAYMLSSAYEAGASCVAPSLPRLQELILSEQRPDGSWGGSLDTAFAAMALMIIGYRDQPLDRAMASLLAHQAQNGSWPRELIFLVPNSNWHYGSSALTTGFAVEALARFLKLRVGSAR